MKKKDVFGFVVLPSGFGAIFLGMRLASGDDARGWIAVVVGVALVAIAVRGLRAK